MRNETISQLDEGFAIVFDVLAIILGFMFFYFVAVGILYFYLALVYPQRNQKVPNEEEPKPKKTEKRPKPAVKHIEFKQAKYRAVFGCRQDHFDSHSSSPSTEHSSKSRKKERKDKKIGKKALEGKKDQNSKEKSGRNDKIRDKFATVIRNLPKDNQLSDPPSLNGKEPAALAYFGPGAENGEYDSKTNITNRSSPKTARILSPSESTATAPSSTLLNTSKLDSLALNRRQEALRTARSPSPRSENPVQLLKIPSKASNGIGDSPQTPVATRAQTGILQPKLYPLLRPL